MYSRVKRKRIHLKKDMYGIPIQEEESGSGSENDTDATGTLIYVYVAKIYSNLKFETVVICDKCTSQKGT